VRPLAPGIGLSVGRAAPPPLMSNARRVLPKAIGRTRRVEGPQVTEAASRSPSFVGRCAARVVDLAIAAGLKGNCLGHDRSDVGVSDGRVDGGRGDGLGRRRIFPEVPGGDGDWFPEGQMEYAADVTPTMAVGTSVDGPHAARLGCAALAEFFGAAPCDEAAMTNVSLAAAAQFTYAVSSEMYHVVLPYVNMATHGDVGSYGALRAAHALVSAGGAVAFGRFADVCGVRAAMLLAHAAAVAFYGVLASARSTPSLFMSVVPFSAMHGYQAAQLVVTRYSPLERRARALGQVGAVYGTGFVAGTVVVAYLGKALHPQELVAVAAGVEAMLLGLLAWQMCDDDIGCGPDSSRVEADIATGGEGSRHSQEETGGHGAALWVHTASVLATPGVFRVLIARFGISTTAHLILSMAPQFAMDPFGLTAAQAGVLLSYVGTVQLASQTGAGWMLETLQKLEPVRDGRMTVVAMATALGGGAVVVSLLSMVAPAVAARMLGPLPLASWRAFALWIGPMAAAQQVVQVALTVELSLRAPQQDLGLLLGVDAAAYSLSGIATPIAAAWLVERHGFAAVPLVSASTALIAIAMVSAPPLGALDVLSAAATVLAGAGERADVLAPRMDEEGDRKDEEEEEEEIEVEREVATGAALCHTATVGGVG